MTREVKECFGKHHTHKKSSTVLNFCKESSLKVLEMISSELKSPEVSVPAKKNTLQLCFVLTSRKRDNYFCKIFLSTTKRILTANHDLSEQILKFISLFSSYRFSINCVFKVLKQFHNINRTAYFQYILFSAAISEKKVCSLLA